MADIIYQPDQERFIMPTDAGDAEVGYRWDGDVMVLWHSEVPRALRGKGAGAKLAFGTFEKVEELGFKARVTCSFLVRVAESDPHWAAYFGLKS